jgi:hypothetical protein
MLNAALVVDAPTLEPRRLIDLLSDDAEVIDALTQAVRDGEVDAYNDLGRFRRRSHRGSRAEAQTLQHLGYRLEHLGFEWEETSSQARYLAPMRFGRPLRVVHCRGELKPGGFSFRIGLKGERTHELINQNRQQMALLEYTATTETTRRQPVQESIANTWLIADANAAGFLSIYLAYPVDLVRDWNNPQDRWHMNLICSDVRLVWEGWLFDNVSPLIERPEAVPIEEPVFKERTLFNQVPSSYSNTKK